MSNITAKQNTQPRVCPDCAALQEESAHFCSECGAGMSVVVDLTAATVPTQRVASADDGGNTRSGSPVDDPDKSVKNAAPATRRSRLRVATVAAAVIVLLAAVTALALDSRATHERLDRTQASLRSSESTLASTRVELENTKSRLAATLTDLTGTRTELASVEKSLADVKKQLATKEQDLRGVRNNLAQVKSSVTIQAAQIETLKSCLNGVSIALGDAAYGDYSAAVSALQAVEVSCDKAYALF